MSEFTENVVEAFKKEPLKQAGAWGVSLIAAGPIFKMLGSMWSKVMDDGGLAAKAGEGAAMPTEFAIDAGKKALGTIAHAVGGMALKGLNGIAVGLDELFKLHPKDTPSIPNDPKSKSK